MSAGQRWDVIIVGAGHNGLTAGAMLARAGLETLVLERRHVIGGACVTEEIAPGCRASTTSYIASMLRPEVIRTLKLGRQGLRMGPCEPAVQVALEGGELLANWTDPARTRTEIERYSTRDAAAFEDATRELRQLSARLQPMLTELPPDTRAGTLRGVAELIRMGGRLRGVRGTDIEGLTRLVSSSLGDYIDARFTSPQVKALLLANNLYGKHGGPYQPGTLIGLVFHMLPAVTTRSRDSSVTSSAAWARSARRSQPQAAATACRSGPGPRSPRSWSPAAGPRVSRWPTAPRWPPASCSPGPIPSARSCNSSTRPSWRRTSGSRSPRSRWTARLPRSTWCWTRSPPCSACPPTPALASGPCSRCRRAWTSPTSAMTCPSPPRSPRLTSYSSPACSPPQWTRPWPRRAGTS